jgi:hypothetical protein
MNTITKNELLKYYLEGAKRIVESQYLELDEQYNLLDSYRWITANWTLSHNVIDIIEPSITINDELKSIVIINIKYKRLTKFGENIGDIELNISKPKSIIKDGEVYEFDKVID